MSKTSDERTQIFSAIHEINGWGGRQSRSGSGSDKEETREIVSRIPRLLLQNDVKTLLDIPCGDMNWMIELIPFMGVNDIKYIGADIVPAIIRNNIERFPGLDFRVLDLVNQKLPRADMIFARDILGHLEPDEVRAALANFKASGAKWLVTTTFPEQKFERTSITGGWRPINLKWYGLIPVELIPDFPEIEKYLGLYRLADYNG